MKFALAASFIYTVLSAVQALPAPGADHLPPASTPPELCCYPTVPLLRAYQPTIHDHFYTTNAAEMQNAVSTLGYNQEGNAATIHPDETPITVPLYRLYNPTAYDHFYTTSASERDNAATNLGYSEEGITGYVYEEQWCGTVPLYRLYNPSIVDHFYTTNAAERDNAANNLGYHYEGIAAYVDPKA
ncbi:hypothetical protein GSI_10586 [Ganoderma sinense ZZ0214-1]|uniref:DUF5648 domain-containing protein n=1 Tax=Ganoderma sinense ZZ0214-1 TaxID=1077348 RepID=A0A2G8S1K6_9APHY|nr:hypothetical protein GSI_10586 [Ganoderma sinense ZZ0214-1]